MPSIVYNAGTGMVELFDPRDARLQEDGSTLIFDPVHGGTCKPDGTPVLTRSGPQASPVLRPMDTAPTDCLIVAYCKHSADPGPDETGRLSLYMGHAEGLSHVEDGWHILVWGGAWDDRTHEYDGGWMPDWWFANDGTFEVAANPIGWLMALPNEEPVSPPPR